MDEVKAVARYLPISPQKMRRVIDQIRGMGALEAMTVLRFMPQKGARLASKLLKSAIANAEENFEYNAADLYIAEIVADRGPMRRWRRFGARGRYKPLLRRSTHLTIVLKEREEYGHGA